MTSNPEKSDGLVHCSVKNAAVLCENHRESRGGSRNVEGGVLIVHVQGRRKQLVVAPAVDIGALAPIRPREARKIFSPSFFSRLDWLL